MSGITEAADEMSGCFAPQSLAEHAIWWHSHRGFRVPAETLKSWAVARGFHMPPGIADEAATMDESTFQRWLLYARAGTEEMPT